MDLQSFFLQKPIVGIHQEVLGRAKRKIISIEKTISILLNWWLIFQT